MTTAPPVEQPMEDPLAAIERELIAAYVTGAGHSLDDLHARDDAEAHRILTEASAYATARLAEVEARSHYVRALRGEL